MTYDNIGIKYGIIMEEERIIWINHYINNFNYMPTLCPQYNQRKVLVLKNKSILNPLKGGYNKAKCKYRFYIRKYFIFKDFPKILAQVFMTIFHHI